MSIYQHFNLTDDQISVNHTMDPEVPGETRRPGDGSLYNLYLPECTSMEYNYYQQKAVQIHTPGQRGRPGGDGCGAERGCQKGADHCSNSALDLDFDIAAPSLTEEPINTHIMYNCANAYFGEGKETLNRGGRHAMCWTKIKGQ